MLNFGLHPVIFLILLISVTNSIGPETGLFSEYIFINKGYLREIMKHIVIYLIV